MIAVQGSFGLGLPRIDLFLDVLILISPALFVDRIRRVALLAAASTGIVTIDYLPYTRLL